jgi:hypothetical protein
MSETAKEVEYLALLIFIREMRGLDFGKGTLNILSRFMVRLPSPFRSNGGISALMSHRAACCHTCFTIQLMHYSHLKHTHFNI